MRRFRPKICSLQSETKFVSHADAKIFFASFRLGFFATNQSEIKTTFFRLISLLKIFRFASKRNEINVFSLCFALKRYEKNVFSLLFTSLRMDLKTKKTTLTFFFVPSQIVPEFHLILFRFAVFASFHFCFASDAKTSEKTVFCIEPKIFCFRFA